MPLTVSQIAEQLGESYERTKYAISRAGVHPIGKAGNVRLFRASDLPRIRATLSTIGRLVRPAPAVEGVSV